MTNLVGVLVIMVFLLELSEKNDDQVARQLPNTHSLSSHKFRVILAMEEIPNNHLGCIKTCK